MPTEHAEHLATMHALTEIDAWMRPETNEGITFGVARLIGVLASSSSFLGGGDLSLYTAGSPRGSLRAQGSTISSVDGGTLATAPIDLTLDLATGKVTATWTDPVTATALSAHLTLEHEQAVGPVGARYHLFHADKTNDAASWTLALTLL